MIPGMTYIPNFVSKEEEKELLREIDGRPWSNELKRRVQHYGYKYNYKARTISKDMYVGPLPDFSLEISKRLLYRGFFEKLPDQLIINEYLPGQGIAAHIDCPPCFDDSIASISLGWPYEIVFKRKTQKISLELSLGSCLIIQGEARYNWTHEIERRKDDNGIMRQRRVSLTFRNIK